MDPSSHGEGPSCWHTRPCVCDMPWWGAVGAPLHWDCCRERSRAGTLPSGAFCHPQRGLCPWMGFWVSDEAMEKSSGVPCAQWSVTGVSKLLPHLCDSPALTTGAARACPSPSAPLPLLCWAGFHVAAVTGSFVRDDFCRSSVRWALWRPAHTSLPSSSTNPGKLAFSSALQDPLWSPLSEILVLALHQSGCCAVFVPGVLDSLSVGCRGVRSGSVRVSCLGSNPRPPCQGCKLGPPPSHGPEGGSIPLSACPKLLELNMDLQVESPLPCVLLAPLPI